MKPETMRKVDFWIGKPVCTLLTLFHNISLFIHKQQNSHKPAQKILFIKMAEQGTTVLAYHAIHRAVEMVGRKNVYFLVFKENAEIINLLNLIPYENVLVVRSKFFSIFFIDILITLWKVRQLNIDAAIDMEFFSRATSIIAFLSGARYRIGLHRFTSEGLYRGNLLTHRIQYNPYLHISRTFYMMVEAIMNSSDEMPLPKRKPPQIDFTPPGFKPSKDELRKVLKILNHASGKEVESPIILLNPNAGDILPLRKWPSESFVELGKEIIFNYPEVTLIITGTKSEQHTAASIALAIESDRVINLAGLTSLRELMVLFSVADILITNDSGPGHFSSMTDIQTISLFGPETPELFGPLGKNTHIISAGLACSPCINALNHRTSPCKNNICMQSIYVSHVFEIVKNLLTHKIS
ncbi:MAG: glycosyltransferase family 9 protein [Thermodesulfobacteriota bacterium]|nr:glycosyltransferase family 9 protein [Thermodesulfobacteriota bacterium]